MYQPSRHTILLFAIFIDVYSIGFIILPSIPLCILSLCLATLQDE